MKIATVKEMRTMDREAAEHFGISEEILMENAGLAAFSIIKRELGVHGKRFSVFCGIGNNGGDGLVVARKLHSGGAAVKVFYLGDPATYSGAAKFNFDIVSRLALEKRQVKAIRDIGTAITESDAIIDAIFGTGLARPVEGIYARVIDRINSSGKDVVSLDIPSGINGDSGKAMGRAINADFTVSFGLPKTGNIVYPGFEHCGELYVSHISFPPSLYGSSEIKTEINIPVRLPSKKPDSYKKNFGEVLFIAGAAGYIGAPYFASYAFLKAGEGIRASRRPNQ